MLKNVPGQSRTVFAFITATGEPVANDEANITAEISLDDAASQPTDDVNPDPVPGQTGYYRFAMTQPETNCNKHEIFPVSSTHGVTVVGVTGVVYPRPLANATLRSVVTPSDGSAAKTVYNLPTHINGDTWMGMEGVAYLDDSTPIDLTNATLRFQIRESYDADSAIYSAEIGSGITVTDAAAGAYSIDKAVISVSKDLFRTIRTKTYVYGLEATLANGDVLTILRGNFPIEADASRAA